MKLARQFEINQNDLVVWDDDDRLVFQNHWRQFAVSIVASVLSCALMLAGFGEILISQRPIAPPRTTAVEAILVEPPPAEPAKPIPIAPILHPAHRKTLAAIKPRMITAPAPAPALNPRPGALPASTVGESPSGEPLFPVRANQAAQAAARPKVAPPRASARAPCMPRLRRSPTIFARTFFRRSRSPTSSSTVKVRFRSRWCNRLQIRA